MRGFKCNRCGIEVTAKHAKSISVPLYAGDLIQIDTHKDCGGTLDPIDLRKP